MGKLYNVLKTLCEEKGITGYRMCKDCGMQPSIMTDLKMGRRAGLKADTAAKVAAYFGVSVDYLLGNTDQKEEPTTENGSRLTEKDKSDIAKDLETMMADLERDSDLIFDGTPASPEALSAIRTALAIGLEYAKKVNKEKYTPKKYSKK